MWWASSALREHGIAVGPSETVDAGRVLTVLGLGDREALREGLACAVLRRPDHRDTYDALFDLWFPAALGGRTVIADADADADGAVVPRTTPRRCGRCSPICWPPTRIWRTSTSGWSR